jgi:hypothetical protein
VPALLAAALLAACSGSGAPSGPTGQGRGYAVVVRDGQGASHRFDLAALRALPQTDVATPQSGGKQTQSGPRVRTVLARAGVGQFGHLKVVGLDASATFSSAEIDDQVVLDFDNRGTVKLAGANLPQARWVRDVTELDPNP